VFLYFDILRPRSDQSHTILRSSNADTPKAPVSRNASAALDEGRLYLRDGFLKKNCGCVNATGHVCRACFIISVGYAFKCHITHCFIAWVSTIGSGICPELDYALCTVATARRSSFIDTNSEVCQPVDRKRVAHNMLCYPVRQDFQTSVLLLFTATLYSFIFL